MLNSYKVILANRPYILLWVGSLVSSFGDRLTEFGLAWYVLGRTQNPVDVGVTLVVFQLPGVFSGVFAGWLLDRYRREAIMLADNVIRGILVGLIPLLDGAGVLSLPLLYLLVGLLGALSVVTAVGSRTLITDFVPPEQYNQANSLDVIRNQVSTIAGPGLAGLLVAVVGPLALLIIDSISFFFFAVVLLGLWRTPHANPQQLNRTKESFLRQITEGVRFTFSSQRLLAILSIIFVWNFGIGIFQVALPFFCNGPLGVGPGGMGLILAIYSAGALISALLFGPLRPKYPGRVVCIMLIAQAGCYGLMWLFSSIGPVVIICFGLGMLDDVAAIYLTTIRQRAIPLHLMGRVVAFTGTVGPGGLPLGNGLAGLFIAGLGSAAVVAISGLPLLAIGLLWLSVGPIQQIVDKSTESAD